MASSDTRVRLNIRESRDERACNGAHKSFIATCELTIRLSEANGAPSLAFRETNHPCPVSHLVHEASLRLGRKRMPAFDVAMEKN